jgi:hypothetical protein
MAAGMTFRPLRKTVVAVPVDEPMDKNGAFTIPIL